MERTRSHAEDIRAFIERAKYKPDLEGYIFVGSVNLLVLSWDNCKIVFNNK